MPFPSSRALDASGKWTLAIRKVTKPTCMCVDGQRSLVREKDAGLEVRGSGGLSW